MERFTKASPGYDPLVTAVASRRVKQGCEQEFEVWVSGILTAANELPGSLGAEELRPSDLDGNEYKINFQFDHASNLHAWETSEERQRWLRRTRHLLQKKRRFTSLPALRPGSCYPPNREPAPPRYKIAVVTWFGVFPVVTVIVSLFGHWLNLLPTLVLTVMVTLMTYVIMPRLTRLFSFWLYQDRR